MIETSPQAPPITRSRRRRQRHAWWLIPMSVATLAILAFMLSAYVPPDMRSSRVDVHGDPGRYWLLVGHISFGSVATVTGLMQFWPWLRSRFPRVHRWSGRTYFFAGIIPAGILAIPVTAMSESGVSNSMALNTLLVVWLVTGVAGFRAARARRFADHRLWMIRNYAATIAIVVSRPLSPIVILITFSQADSQAYQGNTVAMIHDSASAAAWLAVVLSMAVAEIHIQRKYGIRRPNQSRAHVSGAK